MELQTKYHGSITVSLEDVITFPNGLPGFEEEKKFTILSLDEEGVFLLLQSVNTSSLAFVITDPFTYFPSYDFELEDMVVESLSISSPEDVLVYCILTVQEPFEYTTANLQAPVIINKKSSIAKQVVLNNEQYTTRHKIINQ